MKTLFIEAKYKGSINIDETLIKKLPEKIGLVATVQFADFLSDIKKQLEKNNKKIYIGKGKQKYAGQILGCDISSAEKIKKNVDAFLYIGDGRFHPMNVALKTGKKVFCFNPLNNSFYELKEYIEKYNKKKKAVLVKFLSSENIGFIVSIKPGQYNTKIIEKLKQKYKNKKYYTFIADNIDVSQLENFKFIQCWVNTACPRIKEDREGIVNVEDLI